MTDTAPTTCNHERRPGTTVCLQCRNDAAGAARARLLRAVMIGAGVGSVVLAASWVAIGPVLPGVWNAADRPQAPRVAEVVQPEPAASHAYSAQESPPSEEPLSPGAGEDALTEARPLTPMLVPVVAHGRTTLADDVTVERNGPMVTVHFDTELARTRRPEKFDRIVRATLPAVYGVEAESLLAVVPEGMLAAGGDLLSELPDRGVRLPLGDGWQLVLWPETRQGRDGPLVVSYRTVVQR